MALLKNICFASLVLVPLTGCDVVLRSPQVTEGFDETANVRVRSITAETLHQANLAEYSPQPLPAAFSMTSGSSSSVSSVPNLPEAPALSETRPDSLALSLPPAAASKPYRIGISDVVLLSTPQVGGTVEELTGLLAAQNARQGYTVQNGGSINVPNVGRIQIAGLTIREAEDLIFQKLLENQIDPAFSFEIAEFNSRKISVGGAVSEPTIVPITLTPVYLDEVLAAAGGITIADLDFASVRLFRKGRLYQIPLKKLYSDAGLSRIRLIDGDAVFVDSEYDLKRA
jgi:polysaccharide export outer membrane protein